MNDRSLYYLSFAAALVGLLMLWLIPIPQHTFFDVLETCESYDEITLKGKVLGVENRGSVTILKVADAQYVDVVVFDQLDNVTNKAITVKARMSEYKGKINIIATEVKVKE
tara:strand:- start:106 stop:438 length:333 start_codon:yes stop_codon:yes gene_type:complete